MRCCETETTVARRLDKWRVHKCCRCRAQAITGQHANMSIAKTADEQWPLVSRGQILGILRRLQYGSQSSRWKQRRARVHAGSEGLMFVSLERSRNTLPPSSAATRSGRRLPAIVIDGRRNLRNRSRASVFSLVHLALNSCSRRVYSGGVYPYHPASPTSAASAG